jgi:hypothetical protein
MATKVKDQTQPEAAHEERVDPAAGPPAQPPSTTAAEALQDVHRQVEHLQERVEDLEHRGESTPPAVYSDPDHAPSGVNLQEILPRIKDLAQCVGGMKELARIVTTLAESKE